MVFRQLGTPDHDPSYESRQWSSAESRKMTIATAIAAGKGPTQAYEVAVVAFGDEAPTLASVRKARHPGSNKVSPQMELLNVLYRTYRATINPDSSVPGYIQVHE